MFTSKISLLKVFILALTASFILVSCGGGEKAEKPATEKKEEMNKPKMPPSITNLVINGNDAMQFDKKELKAKAGSRVKLTLNHTGKMPVQAMGHNVVILKPGTDLAALAEKANVAAETNYIPKDDNILFHTDLVGGGESTSIMFEAPEPGEYIFICSFPGHYAMMQGKFIVE